MIESRCIKEDDSQNTDALQILVDSQNLSTDVESDEDKRASRFHKLVDKEFLGSLTPEEKQELEILTQWRDDLKNAFYQQYV